MTCRKASGDALIGHESFGEQHSHVLRSFLLLLPCLVLVLLRDLSGANPATLHHRGEVSLGLRATTGETGRVGSGLGRSRQGGSQQTAACARGHGCAQV